jgi:bZIP transcription factor
MKRNRNSQFCPVSNASRQKILTNFFCSFISKVRNRESAAASRQRIRSRITELEDEVGEWKDRYTEAMQRLQRLEQTMASGTKEL